MFGQIELNLFSKIKKLIVDEFVKRKAVVVTLTLQVKTWDIK